MNLEKKIIPLKNKVAEWKFSSTISSRGTGCPFEVRVFNSGSSDSNGELLLIPGYYPEDIVFSEIKKRVASESTVEIKINGDKSKSILYNKR